MLIVLFHKMLILKAYVYLIVSFIISRLLAQPLGNNKPQNNACRTFAGYLNILHSKDCYHIPDLYQNVCTIASNHIGVCENHEVITDDGYILTVFRLPRENPKDVILLQHPATCDARVWLAHYKESTALLFWKAGYDVWLPNNRGTEYSKKHINQTYWDRTFWDFSFHEMGFYDHKATIDYIVAKSNRSKIIYFGYSMSATSALVYASLRPEDAKNKIKVMILLAPSAFYVHTKGSSATGLLLLSHFRTIFQSITNEYSLLAYDSWYITLIRRFLFWFPYKILMVNLIYLFSGPTSDQFDPNYFYSFISTITSEMSWKTFFHIIQLRESNGKFAMYDYGSENNLRVYGTRTPTSYPLEKIENPVYLISGKEDYITPPEDVILLYQNLQEITKIYGKFEISGMSHFDFVLGKNRITKVYPNVFRLLEYIRRSNII